MTVCSGEDQVTIATVRFALVGCDDGIASLIRSVCDTEEAAHRWNDLMMGLIGCDDYEAYFSLMFVRHQKLRFQILANNMTNAIEAAHLSKR